MIGDDRKDGLSAMLKMFVVITTGAFLFCTLLSTHLYGAGESHEGNPAAGDVIAVGIIEIGAGGVYYKDSVGYIKASMSDRSVLDQTADYKQASFYTEFRLQLINRSPKPVMVSSTRIKSLIMNQIKYVDSHGAAWSLDEELIIRHHGDIHYDILLLPEQPKLIRLELSSVRLVQSVIDPPQQVQNYPAEMWYSTIEEATLVVRPIEAGRLSEPTAVPVDLIEMPASITKDGLQ